MTRRLRAPLVLLLAVLMAAPGCHPIQPFYLNNDQDLSHYLDAATGLEAPDVYEPSLAEVEFADEPLTLSNPDFEESWELTLQEVISIALQNSKVIRNAGGVTPFGFSDGLVGRIATGSTVYDTAIVEADPQNGMEAALAAFDAQFSILGSNNGNFATQTDRPSTFNANQVIGRQLGGLRTELQKRTATGLQVFLRNQTDYSRGDNLLGQGQPVTSLWETLFEIELRQPLLRGRGALINRIPILLSRINTDVSVATYEASVRNLVSDIENAYWNLHCAYRALEAARAGRDAAQLTWKNAYEQTQSGMQSVQQEAQAREQYFFFRARLEGALADRENGRLGVFEAESQLRFLMGLTTSDGRLIRPIDDPITAPMEFDWHAIKAEALARSAELRQQKWVIKRRKLELIAAKNLLLPQLDVGATYRWYGVGDHLVNADRTGIDFVSTPNLQFSRNPADSRGPRGSTAFDVLTDGHYQEAAFFFSFQMPVGYRRELAGVRAAQLNLARERARLEDIELNTIHLLATAYRFMDFTHATVQTHANRWKAASEEVNSLTELYRGGMTEINLVLDAQRRQAEAQVAYFNAICDYQRAITGVHFRKGSLLDHNSIYLAEGPWPEKASWDALQQARERDSSYYLNYGWTRPGVISTGPVAQQQGTIVDRPVENGAESIPTPAPRPGDGPPNRDRSREAGPITTLPDGPILNPPRRAARSNAVDPVAVKDAFQWGSLHLHDEDKPVGNAVRQVSAEQVAD